MKSDEQPVPLDPTPSAQAALARMRLEFGYRGHVYVCPECRCLHIGRKRKVKRQEARRNVG